MRGAWAVSCVALHLVYSWRADTPHEAKNKLVVALVDVLGAKVHQPARREGGKGG